MRELLELGRKLKRFVMENPVPHGHAMEIIGQKYSQIVHPWQFGHKELKSTCLWVLGVPLLEETDNVGPPPTAERERERAVWSRVHRESAGVKNGMTREQRRSVTYLGIADAMAEQWGISGGEQR